MITPLKEGDEIRIIAPSFSWRPQRTNAYTKAIERLEASGYVVSLGKHLKETGRLGTALLESRLQDLGEAYATKTVKAILCLNGGWSANELLPSIDWALIRQNPKPLVGFSDITVLLNAIYARTGNIGLLGPNLGSLGGRSVWQYTLQNLTSVLSGQKDITLKKSPVWQSGRAGLQRGRPWRTIQPGAAKGTLIGGNIGTFYLLQGTDYAPKFVGDIVLALEDDDEAGKFTTREFDRRLESLLQQKGARQSIKAVLIGRFQPSSRVAMPDIQNIVSRKLSKDIVVVADIDFGHTKPLLTLPIGGKVLIDATGQGPKIKLIEY